MVPDQWYRRSIEEALELRRLPNHTSTPTTITTTQRFMSCQPAWSVGNELPRFSSTGSGTTKLDVSIGRGAFGGCVYALAPLAAARVVEKEDELTASPGQGKRSIHVRTLRKSCSNFSSDQQYLVHTRCLYQSWEN